MSEAPPQTPADIMDQVEGLLAHFEKLEAQFEHVREGLTHSHRLTMLGTIASIIAHEYNNILTPIISYAQLALARPDDLDLNRKAIEKALAGAERAARISSSMLGFATDTDERPIASLRQVIDDTFACMAREPKKDGIELVIDVPNAAAAMRPLNLQQVLMNLILNARRAMRRRGGRLSVTATADGRTIRISVADSGPGIPPAILDRLFEPFVTHRIGDEPGSDPDPPGRAPDLHEPKGTGLGLCICRDMVRAAGGEITVDSEPGQGATFHLELPQAAAYEST